MADFRLCIDHLFWLEMESDGTPELQLCFSANFSSPWQHCSCCQFALTVWILRSKGMKIKELMTILDEPGTFKIFRLLMLVAFNSRLLVETVHPSLGHSHIICLNIISYAFSRFQ